MPGPWALAYSIDLFNIGHEQSRPKFADRQSLDVLIIGLNHFLPAFL